MLHAVRHTHPAVSHLAVSCKLAMAGMSIMMYIMSSSALNTAAFMHNISVDAQAQVGIVEADIGRRFLHKSCLHV